MATARVKVTLEVEVRSSWGNECKLEQIEKQATEDALGALRNGLRDRFTIIGAPEVICILVPTKGKL